MGKFADKKTLNGARASFIIVFALFISAFCIVNLVNHKSAYADPPQPGVCDANVPTQKQKVDDQGNPEFDQQGNPIYIALDNKCYDLTLEAVQDGLLEIRDLIPSNTPTAYGQTTYTITGATISGAARAQVASMSSENLKKIPSQKWTEFTITNSTDRGDTINVDGVSVTWGGYGERTLTVSYDSGYTSPNQFDQNNPTHMGTPGSLSKTFVVKIEGSSRPRPGTPIPGGDGSDNTPKGTCSVAAYNENDCISQGGKWTPLPDNPGSNPALTGVAVGAILLLIAAILLLALLLKRRKKKEEDLQAEQTAQPAQNGAPNNAQSPQPAQSVAQNVAQNVAQSVPNSDIIYKENDE